MKLKIFFQGNECLNSDGSVVKNPSNWLPPGPAHPLMVAFEEMVERDLKVKEAEQRFPFWNLSKEEHVALENLKHRQDVVYKPAVKGGSLVILNRGDYEQEVYRQLGNERFFKRLNENPTSALVVQISEVITEALSVGWVTVKEAAFLINRNPQIPVFYILPKIHKSLVSPPGHPIVAGINSVLEPLSIYVDHFLRPFVPLARSYVMDSSHLILILQSLPKMSETILLVSMDIESLYSSIPQRATINLIQEVLETRINKKVPTHFLVELATIALTQNYFMFKNEFFQQVHGTAMGATMAPDLACLYVSAFEERYVYPSTWYRHVRLWCRYIDDILLVWSGTRKDFERFFQYLNAQDGNLKFTCDVQEQWVPFLDMRVGKKNGFLVTELYRKTTDRNGLLHFNSFHPKHIRENIPLGQFFRVRRICTDMPSFKKHAKDLQERFKARGYPDRVVNHAYRRARYINRDLLLQPKKTQKSHSLVCVLPYSNRVGDLIQVIKNHWHLVSGFVGMQVPPMFSFKRSQNLRDILVHSDLGSGESRKEMNGGHHPCTGCSVCKFSLSVNFFIHPVSGKKMYLRNKTTCQSSSVVYIVQCPCGLFYVGKTTRKVRIRILEHCSRIRNEVETAPLVKHWQEYHHTVEELRFFVIQEIHNRRGGNINKTLLRLEQRLIFSLGTLWPKGLNDKIDWVACL
ncbi:uncharacterized protein LOC115097463 [Rhinatrema bivittatum]|uniref:uncharacterized protein LOC115097463 n=1 Tax=Rhinatrema bivittatum TaxID=194408 RepID=UPI00112A8659|nr:uncharacterized protein LOC115097463 [Rhinatrema bivittatum]XP_029469169.1 uncharacterized protein LOC115097463 [Rhinatrema bivittatum]